jgi:hypothetical protein
MAPSGLGVRRIEVLHIDKTALLWVNNQRYVVNYSKSMIPAQPQIAYDPAHLVEWEDGL